MKKRSHSMDINTILMRTVAVLLMLVLISSGMVTGRYARYVTTASFEDSARVAKFYIMEQNQADLSVGFAFAKIAPGESASNTIQIVNDSEVAVDYTIEIKNVTQNLPLAYSVTAEGAELTKNVVDDYTATFTDSMPATFNGTRTYTLNVGWGGDPDPRYGGMVDYLQITLRAEQAD